MQKMWHRIQTIFRSDYLWWGVVLLGILLRLRQYLLNRSFWLDEANLALNIVNRNFRELTQLLDYHQAAPIGFLFIEKFSIVVFGNHDYILRLFPLIAGCLAVYFLYRFARTHLGTAGLFALVMFAISWWLVYYSSELKQYISDVMAVTLLIFLAGNCLKEKVRGKDYLLLGVVGSIVIWISHPSVFILAGIGIVLVIEKLIRKEYVPWTWILGIGAGWLASFGIEYLVSLQHIVADGYLTAYWEKAYIPSPPWTNKAWYFYTYYNFLLMAFYRSDNVMAIIMLVLTIIGSLSLLIRDRKIALLLILPFIMTFIASALHRYPLKNRFVLFIIPLVFLLMAEGFRGIYWLVAKWKPGFSAVFSGILALAMVWQIAPISYEKATSDSKSDLQPVMEYVEKNRQPDDIVYVYQKTGPAFKYYVPFYGLDSGNVIIGVDGDGKRDSFQKYEDDVTKLAGNDRVWFIFTEVADCGDCEEEGTLSYYLDVINRYGVQIDNFDGVGGNAFLYDMGF